MNNRWEIRVEEGKKNKKEVKEFAKLEIAFDKWSNERQRVLRDT